MTRSDTLWDFFRATGYIGAYLLYCNVEGKTESSEETLNVTSEPRGVAGI